MGEASLSGRGDSRGELGVRTSLFWPWACVGGGGSCNGGGGEYSEACGDGEVSIAEVSIAGGVIIGLDRMAEPGSGDIEGPWEDGEVFGESRLFTEESLPREKIEEIRRACLLVMVDFWLSSNENQARACLFKSRIWRERGITDRLLAWLYNLGFGWQFFSAILRRQCRVKAQQVEG